MSAQYKSADRFKVVYLGTPEVAARALEIILEEKHIQVIAVVSQPPARAKRGGGEIPSPVHALALSRGIPVLVPETAKDMEFLDDLEKLAPDLCITAAYGNILPDRFLAIPKFGTLNIHPSLLPLYRGAAPVQRTVEAGDAQTGVTVARSVKALDAGPIVAQKTFSLDPDINALTLLRFLFEEGAKLLLSSLPGLFEGSIELKEQDHSLATHAKKLSKDESIIDFFLPATTIHNKVRAFAGWPGAWTKVRIGEREQAIKILRTRVLPAEFDLSGSKIHENERKMSFINESFCVRCGQDTHLEILELQPEGKRAMKASDFQNGLKKDSELFII